MTSEHEIGRVVSVDTSELMVELNRDLKALTRSTYEGAIEVGRINSYLIIPVGSRRIVAMVTRVELTEDSETKTDKNMVSLPSSRRILQATMIGSIDENQFRQGINLFPVLDSKVFLTTKEDLDAIFGKLAKGVEFNPDEPGYCVPIGKSAVFPDYEIKMDPDAFFGKHAAIIGSTGSGKSCSIATILQSVISDTRVTQTRIVILDTNGEYRAAFQRLQQDGTCVDAFPNRRSLYIPTDSAEVGRLAIPYWFMDSDDFVRLFRAAPGVQRPILLNALSSARAAASKGTAWLELRDRLLAELNRLLAFASGGDKSDAKQIRQLSDGDLKFLATQTTHNAIAELTSHYPSVTITALNKLFMEVRDTAREGLKDEGQKFESYAPIDADKRQRIEQRTRQILGELARLPSGIDGLNLSTADSPSYFSKQSFRYEHLETAMSRNESSSARARDNASTMLMRIYRLLEDSRFDFLFGPASTEWPQIKHSLAAFLRDIIGLSACEGAQLSDQSSLPSGVLPYYDRQRASAEHANVVIVDLSLLASEVLENVTALIGRLIHEFLQRLSDPISGVGRGEFPIVLVLEEAQNYIRETGRSEEDSISKQVFERIAREGRKYGLGLVVASQRPSELSKTVLSQCNSFIVHRLQNPEDLRYFREIVPGIYVQLLNQLPALAPRSALVLGECVQAPVLVVMRECDPQPRSKNPKFFKSWTSGMRAPDVEAVCAKWEGAQASTPQGSTGESAIGDGQQ
jgi:DNA helicase HerA-like ATPase